MKSRILLFTALLVIGAGCKGNGGAKKAASPAQLEQLNLEERQRNAYDFLSEAHELRRLGRTPGGDRRVVAGRLLTGPGFQGTAYDLKLKLRDAYGREYGVRQRGQLVPRSDFSAIDMHSVSGAGVAGVVGSLTVIVGVDNSEKCALLRVYLGPGAGNTRVLLCEDEDYQDLENILIDERDDNRNDDRRDGRHRRR